MPSSTSDIRLDLERRILGGELQPGSRLPSVRAMAGDLGVAPGTVAAAYRQLAEVGLVTAGRGRQGTRVAPRSNPLPIRSSDLALSDGVVDARHGSPDPALLPPIGRAIAEAVEGLTTTYGTALVHPDLADAATTHFAADGISFEALTVTSGAMDAIDRALRAQPLRTGDRVGVEDPGHVPVHQLVRSAGLVPVPLALDDRGIRPEALQRALAEPLAAVIMTPRAQNPTGAAFTPGRTRELTEILVGHPEVVVIQDDHAGPVAGTDYHEVTPPGPRWITIRSMGKSYGPDLRLALVVGDRDTIARMAIGFGNGPGWVSHILQRAVAFLLQDPGTAELVEVAAETYRHNRHALIDALAERGIVAMGRSGFNVWVPGVHEQATVDLARQRGFAIVAGDQWRIQSPSAVRISISTLTDEHVEPLAAAITEARDPLAQRSAWA